MNEICTSLCWAAAQTVPVAALAIGLSRFMTRRSPSAGAAVAVAGMLAVLALTIASFLPAPQGLRRRVALDFSSTPHVHSLRSPPATREMRPLSADGQPGGSFNLTLPGHVLRGLLASLDQSRPTITASPAAIRAVCGLAMLGVMHGLARIAIGLWSLGRLDRRSSMIADDRAVALLEDLQIQLELRQLPQLRETHELRTAAMFGWWRPTVMLPTEWRDWTTAELRAVLAHELAHVRRRDFALRVISATALALHCVQPLMHWLQRQLLLAQELAADELAASAAGRGDYLQALCTLALRQDGRPIDWPARTSLPVFSSFIKRRIEMLRAKDGSTRSGRRGPLLWMSIAAVMLSAAGGTALRALAQPPSGAPNSGVRVARTNESKSKPGSAPGAATPAALFQRPKFDPAAVARGKRGGFVFRVGDLLGRDDLRGQVGSLNRAFAEGWKLAFSTAEAPAWPLDEIEYIAGDLLLATKRLDKPTATGESNQLTLGAGCMVVRWKDPLAGQFDDLARLPGSTKKQDEQTEYIELPVVPIFGPQAICVCRVDDHTLLCALSKYDLLRGLTALTDDAGAPAWKPAWETVERGVLTMATTNEELSLLEAPKDELERQAAEIIARGRVYALGLDFQNSPSQFGMAKLCIGCATADDAQAVKRAIRAVTDELFKRSASAADDAVQPADLLIAATLESLKPMQIDVLPLGDAWQVALQAPVPWILDQWRQSIDQIND